MTTGDPSPPATSDEIDTDGETLTLPVDATTSLAAMPGEFRVVDPVGYERGEEIARGGMGRIVAAHDLRHDRPVALKEPLVADDELVARFRREALITARLQHPAIVPIYEAGLWPDGRPFFAMRRVDGRALDQVIRERTTLAERLPLVANTIAVCEALAYAHMRGVVHRDLKPHNVLVGAYGETVVIDWGLARRVGSDEAAPRGSSPVEPTMTLAGGAVGTPAYMAPEQARGATVDERADVYALGALLYHVLAGRAPYDDTAARANQLVEVVAAGPPTPLVELVEGVPPELAAIVDKAMAREPKERYRSALELAADLRRFGEGRLVGAHRYTLGTLLARWARRHRLALAVATALALTSVIAAVVYVRGLRIERARTAAQRQVALDERARAERAAARAEAQTRTLLVEQGRQRLDGGRPLEAAAYLARAYQLGDASLAVRALLGLVMPSVDAKVLRHGDGPTQTVAAAALDVPRGRVFTASWDRTIGVWDLATGAALARHTHGAEFASAVVLPDGDLVTGDRTGSIVRWAPLTGAATVLGQLPAIVLWLELSRDGSTLAATAFDGSVATFDVATGAPGLRVTGTGRAQAAIFTSGDRELIVPGLRPTRWDLTRGRAIAPLPEAALRLAVASDGRLAGAAGVSVWVWRGDGALQATRRTGNDVALLRWLDDDLLMIGTNGELVRWSPATDQVRWTSALGDAQARSLAIVDDRIFVASSDGLVRVIDSADGATVGVLAGHDGEVYGVAAGGAWAVTFSSDGTARRWRLDEVLPRAWTQPRTRALRRGPDGRLATAGPDGVRVWTQPAGAAQVLSTTPANALAFTVDGRAVVVAEATEIVRYPLDGGPATRVATTGAAHALAPLADGRVAIATDVVRLWDPVSGQTTAVTSGPLDHVSDLIALPGGGLALTNGRLAVAVSLAGTTLGQCGEHTTWINAMAVGADGTIASGDASGAVWLWTADGAAQHRLPSAGGPVTALAVGGDGRLYLGSADGAVRIWERSGRLLATLRGPRAPIAVVTVDADNRTVATLDAAGRLRVWPVALEARAPAALAAAVAEGTPFEVDDDGRLRTRAIAPH